MRWTLIAAAVLVVGAGAPLFLAPTQTERLFVFPVEPALTAAFFGANFWSAAVIEALSATRRRWADARAALPGVFSYTVLTGGFSIANLGQFNPNAGKWVWLAVYTLFPVAMIAAWLVQRRAPGAEPPRGAPLPRGLRVLLGALSGVVFGLGVVMVLFPMTGGRLWAWELTPPSARYEGAGGGSMEPYVGCWLIGIGAVAAGALRENDARRAVPIFAGAVALAALHSVVLIRFGGQIMWWFPEVWAFAGAVAACGVAGTWGLVVARRSQAEPTI